MTLQATSLSRSAQAELYPFLSLAVSALRWATLAVLFVLTTIEPRVGRLGMPNWALILLFAVYNLAIELLIHRFPDLPSLNRRVLIDLPLAAIIYSLGGEPGSPLFVLLFLAVICAAVSMPVRASLIYTAVAISLTVLIEPTMPYWAASTESIRELGTRVTLLALAGVGTSILTRRLVLERDMARAARDEAQRLAERARLHDEFISTVSHNLRTPFTSMRAGLGLVQASLADRLRPDEEELLGELRSNTDRLGIHINDLLAFNQLEAGALRIEPEPCDLRAVITDAIAAVHPLISEKGQILEVDLPEPLPAMVDGRRMEQVLVNLLDNAHQHTSPGTRIAISGSVEDRGVLVAVSDHGPGVSIGEQQAIFERFHSNDAAGGWGLGLAIAKAIVEMHRGRIWVDSSPGKGATFSISLPRQNMGEHRNDFEIAYS